MNDQEKIVEAFKEIGIQVAWVGLEIPRTSLPMLLIEPEAAPSIVPILPTLVQEFNDKLKSPNQGRLPEIMENLVREAEKRQVEIQCLRLNETEEEFIKPKPLSLKKLINSERHTKHHQFNKSFNSRGNSNRNFSNRKRG